jgi:hypothetical protein
MKGVYLAYFQKQTFAWGGGGGGKEGGRGDSQLKPAIESCTLWFQQTWN